MIQAQTQIQNQPQTMAPPMRDWLQHFTPEDQRWLRERGRPLRVARGGLVFQQDSPATDVFWLLSGQIHLIRLFANGNQRTVDMIEGERVFAEATPFFDEQTYPVTAVAATDCQLLAISHTHLLAALRRNPEACFWLLRDISRRLHRRLTENTTLSRHAAITRVARFIQARQREVGEDEFTLPATKAVIASRLSMAPETLSRLLRKLERDGVVQNKGARMRVCQRDALAALADGG